MTDRDERETLRSEIKALRVELDEAERRRLEDKAPQEQELASKRARVHELRRKIDSLRPMSRETRERVKRGFQIGGILLGVLAYVFLSELLGC